MTTKIRLVFSFSLQLILLILWGISVYLHPDYIWEYSWLFVGSLVLWQMIHAWYLARKYQDWHQKRYLKNLRKVLGYSLLILGIGWVSAGMSFGALVPFGVFLWDIVWRAACVILAVLVWIYFVRSIINLYQYYYRPRSFWDL